MSLYAAFRGLVRLGVGRSASRWRHRVAARLALVLFAALCYGYYRLCVEVGYAMAWGFLAGFPFAAPFAVAAVRSKRRWMRWAAECAVFAAYFWASGFAHGWKAAWGG